MSYLALLATLFFMTASAFGGAHAHYGLINSYLTSHVPNNDEIGPNLEAAANWLKQQEGKRLSFLSSAPVHDLKKFTALQQVVDDTDCDETAYRIMLSNERAVDLYGTFTDKILIRRVDKVILKVFVDHAERCRKIHPIKYRWKIKQLDCVFLEHVANLSKLLMEKDRFIIPERRFYQPGNLFHRYIEYPFPIGRYIGKNVFKAALVLNAKEVPGVEYLDLLDEFRNLFSYKVNKNKMEEIVLKYLFGPCRRFVSEFGPDLFGPAILDSEFYTVVEESDLDYYLGWVSFSMCLELSRNERLVLNDIIKSYK